MPKTFYLYQESRLNRISLKKKGLPGPEKGKQGGEPAMTTAPQISLHRGLNGAYKFSHSRLSSLFHVYKRNHIFHPTFEKSSLFPGSSPSRKFQVWFRDVSIQLDTVQIEKTDLNNLNSQLFSDQKPDETDQISFVQFNDSLTDWMSNRILLKNDLPVFHENREKSITRYS